MIHRSLALRLGLAAFATAALAAASIGCVRTIKVPGECDGGSVIVVPTEPLHAQALYVLDLDRGAVNLAGSYAGIINRLHGALALAGVVVDQHAVLPLYGGPQDKPVLVWGTPAEGAGDLSATLGPLASSGRYDGPLAGITAESSNLALIAGSLDAATLPPDISPDQSRPFYSTPKDIFLIVTIAPTRRLCALTDDACRLGGMSPVDAFSSTTGDGRAQWLKLPGGTYPKKRVYQVFITTSEAGETATVMRARCGSMAGFPKGLLDVIEPSPDSYYVALAAELGKQGWRAERLDLCETVSALGDDALKMLGARIAQAASQ